MINIRIEGTQEPLRALERYGAGAIQKGAEALYAEAELIMTESKRECPVDTGALRDTGHVEQPEISGDQVTVQMGYGGPAAPYAVYVHENLTAQHPVGKAKYLEDPVNEAKPTLPTKMARRLRNGMGL